MARGFISRLNDVERNSLKVLLEELRGYRDSDWWPALKRASELWRNWRDEGVFPLIVACDETLIRTIVDELVKLSRYFDDRVQKPRLT